jgi:hypothetical protein
MVLTLSGAAGAIGFSYTDTTTDASGTGGITYTLNINENTGVGTLAVSGNYSAGWSLTSVAFKLAGIKLGDAPSGFFEMEAGPVDGIYSFNINDLSIFERLPDGQIWSLKAEYSGPEAGKSGKAKHAKLIVKVPGSVPVPVPEPSTLFLIGSGLLGIAAYGFARARFRRKK